MIWRQAKPRYKSRMGYSVNLMNWKQNMTFLKKKWGNSFLDLVKISSSFLNSWKKWGWLWSLLLDTSLLWQNKIHYSLNSWMNKWISTLLYKILVIRIRSWKMFWLLILTKLTGKSVFTVRPIFTSRIIWLKIWTRTRVTFTLKFKS